MTVQTRFRDIDDYISTFPEEVQGVLESIRRTISEAVPQTQEKISYHMPTFVVGSESVHIAAWKKHIGLYGCSRALETFKEALSPYVGEKGSLRFPLDRPMPLGLIGDIARVELRVERG